MQTCLQKAGITFGGAQGGQGAPPAGGQGGGGLGGGGARGAGERSAFAKCLPARLQRFRATITTPEQTLQQVVNPPQTNIKSSTYTIAGVDATTPDIGVVTASLVSSGRFLAASKGAGAHEALLSSTYASRESLKVGSKLDLNGTTFTVVGLVRPPLGGQTADVYISLPRLGAREPEGLRQRTPRSGRERSIGRGCAEADRDALPESAGRERQAGRRLD